jgi:hypothetical protein
MRLRVGELRRHADLPRLPCSAEKEKGGRGGIEREMERTREREEEGRAREEKTTGREKQAMVWLDRRLPGYCGVRWMVGSSGGSTHPLR